MVKRKMTKNDVQNRDSTHLQKIGRLDFSLRKHEGEVKAITERLQQLHKDIFLQKCVVSSRAIYKKLSVGTTRMSPP
jgi:hypothetical protein